MFSRRTEWKLTANHLTQAIAEMRRCGGNILDLTISNPTRAKLAYDRAAILDSLRNEHSLDYDPQPKGLLPAREAVAKYYAGRGETVDPEFLFLTSGTSEGYSYLFRLLANPDDEILAPRPSYPLFDFLAGLDDVRLSPYPLIYDHGWQIDFHSLEGSISNRTRAIVLVNPNNPTGSYISGNERARLNELCARKEIALIVDEVFLDYFHDTEHRQSFATNENLLTFTLSGLSKISALPQMKLAWIAVSGPDTERSEAAQRLEVIADTYLSVGAPVQWAAEQLLEQSKSVQSQLMERVCHNIAELDRQLATHKSCSRLMVEGGWYVILRVPVTQSDEDLTLKLLREESVLVHPGHFYDFPCDGYLIISLIAHEADFCEGIARIFKFLNA